MTAKVLLDVELKLILLGLGPSFEDADVRCVLLAFVFDESFVELVVELEVACGEDLKDGVTIVFEEENVVVGLVFDFDIGEALSSEEADVDAVSLESFDQYALPEFQISVVFLF